MKQIDFSGCTDCGDRRCWLTEEDKRDSSRVVFFLGIEEWWRTSGQTLFFIRVSLNAYCVYTWCNLNVATCMVPGSGKIKIDRATSTVHFHLHVV
jgi:hypothetical protein